MNAKATSENERLATWVRQLEECGWVKMDADQQMASAEGVDDELFWIAVDIVTERDLANR